MVVVEFSVHKHPMFLGYPVMISLLGHTTCSLAAMKSNILEKLGKYGIQVVEVHWFCDYLPIRMQYVTYNNHISQKEKTTCGVPWGSILGPRSFLLYINNLANVSSHCFSISFADDTNIFISDRNFDVLCNQLNEDLREIQEWLNCNELSINVL